VTRPLIAFVLVFLTTAASCCNVPVFRYALERWEPDPFQLVIFHTDPLSAEVTARLQTLEPLVDATDARPNWQVITLDANQAIPPLYAHLWKSQKSLPMPSYALCIPEWRKTDPALATGALSLGELTRLIASPIRTELLTELLKGTAVTWLVVETTDEAANKELQQQLREETARLLNIIQIPPNIGKDGINVLSELPVEVSFATITMRADDPQEAMLLQLLSNGDAIDEPTLYPIFGRGRALAAMPASTVTKELLEETARFLCGACSCQVKAQNPGFDLLMSAHWTSIFGDSIAPPTDRQRPPTAPQLVPIPPRKSNP
jgi:hypothetical protein